MTLAFRMVVLSLQRTEQVSPSDRGRLLSAAAAGGGCVGGMAVGGSMVVVEKGRERREKIGNCATLKVDKEVFLTITSNFYYHLKIP
jgi:hypothetical protein